MPLCYRYDQQKKEYVGSEEMLRDPLETIKQKKDIWVLPADCTLMPPPEAKEGFKIKWTGEAWAYEEEKKEENELPQYEPTDEEKKQMKRWERNDALEKVMERVQRYQTQKVAGLETTETSETVEALLLYAQYLRDFPQQDGEWWNAPILTFEEWGAAQ